MGQNEEGDEQVVSGERGYRRRRCVCSAVAIIRKDKLTSFSMQGVCGGCVDSPRRRPMDRLKACLEHTIPARIQASMV